MTEIKDTRLSDYLDELAGKQATPGGGSAAALSGAQAASLVSMVCNLTIGKKKYVEVEEEMQALLRQSEDLRQHLLGMIQADVQVFDRLMSCYGLAKETDTEKAHRIEQIQLALKEATQVPLQCAKACSEVLSLCEIAAEKGSLGVISDAGVAVMSAYNGLKSAALNVYINTGAIKDQDFNQKTLAELEELLEGADLLTEKIYQTVKEKL